MHYPTMGAAQQAPQLPYSAQQPQHAMLNISLNPLSPPFIPQIQTDPQLQQYISLISAVAAAEIQQRAQSNPLRMFMFNRYAINNFANQDFSSLIGNICDYVFLMLYLRRVYPNIDVAIQDAIPKVLEMMCAVAMQEYPGLQAFVDQNTTNAAFGMIQQFQAIGAEVGNYKRSGQWPGGVQTVAPTMVPMHQYTTQPLQGGGWQTQGGWQGTQQARASGNTGLFRSGPNSATPGVTETPQRRFTDRWSVPNDRHEVAAPAQQEILRQPYEPRKPTMNTQATDVTTLLDSNEPQLTPIHDATWSPRPNYSIWYLPAYNPVTHELMIQTQADGQQTPVLKTRTKPMMEYDRHKLKTVFGAAPAALDLSHTQEALQRITKGVRILSGEEQAPATNEDGSPYKPSVYVNPKWMAETSYASAWLSVGLERLQLKETDGNPDIYRRYVQIAEPIVGMRDETDVLRNYGSASTFVELREKLNATINEVSPALWGAIERKLTATVNRILSRHMSIPKLQITSFVTDLDDLLTYLDKQYGDEIKTAFLRHQRQHIRNTFVILGEDADGRKTADVLSEGLIDPSEYEEGKPPKITYLTSEISLTYLNCRSFELELDLASDVASALTPDFTPVLYGVIDTLFKEDGHNGNVERHLLRTNDGRVLEATKGYIGSGNGHEFYLITLIA